MDQGMKPDIVVLFVLATVLALVGLVPASAEAATSGPAFQRVPAGAGVLFSRPVSGKCPYGFLLGVVWDQSSIVDAELSGRYAVDEFGTNRFFQRSAGRSVTLVTFGGRLVRGKATLHKGDRICQRMDPQGNKPIADPAGTIMGLPAGFPKHPTVEDIKALGLSTSTRTVPTFQVPQPASARSRAQLPTSVTLGSVQSAVLTGTTPHIPVPGDPAAPFGFSPDRSFDVTMTYRVSGGSGVLTVKPTGAQFTTSAAADEWEEANVVWQHATGFTDSTKPGRAMCCAPPYVAQPLANGSSDLTLTYRGVILYGVPLQADGSPRAPNSLLPLQLGPIARGTFDDFGQEYLPLSSTWAWSVGQDFGRYDPKVNAGCHSLTTTGDSCNVDPDGRFARDPASTGLVWIPVGV